MSEFDVLLRFAALVLSTVLALSGFLYASRAWIAWQRRQGECALTALGPWTPPRLLMLLAQSWQQQGYRLLDAPGSTVMRVDARGQLLWVATATAHGDRLLAQGQALAHRAAAHGAHAVLACAQPLDGWDERRLRAAGVRVLGPAALWSLIGATLEPGEQQRAARALARGRRWQVSLPTTLACLSLLCASVLLGGFGWGPDLLPAPWRTRELQQAGSSAGCMAAGERSTQGFESLAAPPCPAD
ncbi:MAG: hypothetical protein U1F26_16620 [Lysobacterales bacterium]